MAIDKFNSVDGFSTGFPPRNIIDGNANVDANAITATAGANIAGNTLVANLTANGNVTLGAIANVHITGGSAGQIVTTDGNGNLSFTAAPAVVAGSNTQIQFNDNGVLAGNANLTFNKTTGNLSVGGNLQANGNLTTSKVVVSANTANASANIVGIQSNSSTANYTLTLPANAGSAGQIITTDGTGVLSFANAPVSVAGANTQVQFNDAGNLAGSANFTFDKSNNRLTTNNIAVGSTITANTANVAFLNVANDAVVQGNLTVNGNVTYINSNVTNIEDPVIQLGGGPNGANLTSYDGKDRGVLLQNYTNATGAINEFMGYQTANGTFVLASNATVNNNVVTVNTLGNLQIDTLNGANVNVANVVANFANANTANVNIINANVSNANTVNVAGNVNANVGNFSGNVTANFYNGNGINLTGVVHNAANTTTAVQYNVGGNFAGNAGAFNYNDGMTTLTLSGSPFRPSTFSTAPQSPIAIAYGKTANGSFNNSYVIIDTLRNSANTAELSPIYISNTGGANWTFTNANTHSQMNDIAFGNGWAIAVGINGTLSRTSDLGTWSAIAFGGNLTGNFTAITYANVTGGPVFIAVGDSGTIATSSDNGQNWTPRSANTSKNLTAVVYDGAEFNIVGANGGYWHSSDGISWNYDPIADLANSTINDIAFNGQGTLYAVADGGYIASTEVNGTPLWKTRKISEANLTAITYTGNSAAPWLAVSATGGQAFISNVALDNGSYFDTVKTNLAGTVTLTDVASNGTGFVFINTEGPGIANNGAQLLPNPSVGTVVADEANVFHLKVTGVSQLGDVSRVGIAGGEIVPAALGAVTIDSSGAITAIAIDDGGSGYDVPPTITITGAQTGTNPQPAVAIATVSGGAITAISIVDGGTGYTSASATVVPLRKYLRTDGYGNLSWYSVNPNPVGGSGKPGGSNNQLQFNSNGAFGGAAKLTYDDANANFNINATHVNFSNVANINIPGGATQTAVLGAITLNGSGNVTNVAITSGGFGYDFPPTITITGANTAAANITGIISNVTVSGVTTYGVLTGITINSGGTGYDSGTISSTVTAPTTKFLKTNGSGNLAWSEVRASGSSTSGAPGGSNTNIQFNDNGVLNGSAAFTFNKTTNTVATGNFVANGANVTLGAVGNLHITGGNANTAVAGSASLYGNGAINTVVVATAGDGYTIAPKVTVTGSNTRTAVLTTTIDANGSVTNINVIDGGLGYTTATVSIAAPTIKYLQTNGNGNVSFTEVPAGAQVAGSDNQIQFNNNGVLTASPTFTYDNLTNVFTVGNTTTGAVTIVGNANNQTSIALTANNGTNPYTVTIKQSIDANVSNLANWSLTLPGNAGANLQFLQTDGTGVAKWVTPSFIANGTSNVRIPVANGNVVIGSNGQANIVAVYSNGAHATTTVQDDVIITGNLQVTGNINYADINNLNIQEPIINLGTGANDSPLITTDAYDRGQAYHFYNTNLVQTTVNASISVGGNVVTLPSTLSFTGIANGLAFYANAANGAAIFPAGTVISNVDSANYQVTVNANATIAGTTSDAAYIGSDILNFAGFDQSAQEFVFGTNVAIANFVTTITNYGNIRGGNFIGNLANGNTAVTVPASNGNIVVNVTGTNAVATFSNTAVTLGSNVGLAVQNNNGTSIQQVQVKASNNAAFTANWTMTLPTGNGYAYGAVVPNNSQGGYTLDGSGGIATVTINANGNVGFGYTSAPAVTVTGSNTRTAALAAVLAANGSVSSFTIIDAGTGYDANAVITIAAPAPKYLKTDGNGVTSWSEVVGGGGSSALGYAISNGNSNVTVNSSANVVTNISGVANVLVANANVFTANVNVVTTQNLTANGNIISNTGVVAPNATFATSLVANGTVTLSNANVNFADPSTINIANGLTGQYLKSAGNAAGDTLWANGTIQYLTQNQYGNSNTQTATTASIGANTIVLTSEVYSYTNQGALNGSSAANANVTVTNDITANVAVGDWVKFTTSAFTVANVYQVTNISYDSPNTQTVITIGNHPTISSPANVYLQSANTYWDFGNTIGGSQLQLFAGNTQLVFGTDTPNVGIPNNLVTIQSISHQPDAGLNGSVLTIYPTTKATVLSGANVVPVTTSGINYIDTVNLSAGLSGAVTSNRVLTLGVDTANISGIGNGTTNVSIPVANGNIYVNVNAQQNVAVFSSGNITTNNTNVTIANGNLTVSNTITANVVNANVSNANSGVFADLLSLGNTRTNNLWMSGSITGGTLIGANFSASGSTDAAKRANLPTVVLSNGGGNGAQVSVGWSNVSGYYISSGLSIVNAGIGYTTLPDWAWSSAPNATLNTAGNLVLQSNIGNISNVHIPGGSNGQFIQTDGNGNLSFTSVGVTVISGTNYGNGITNLTNAFYVSNTLPLATGYPAGTQTPSFFTNANIQASNIFAVGQRVQIDPTSNAWYTITGNISTISANSSGSLVQFSVAPSLRTAVNNGTLTLVANTDVASLIAGGKNITINYDASNVGNITAVASGANTQIQYNSNGYFDANSLFTYDPTTNTMSVTNANLPAAGNLTANGNVSFTTANSSGSLATYVTFGNVARIVIPGGNSNAGFANSSSFQVNAIGAIQNTITLVPGGEGDGYDPAERPLVTFSGPNTQVATGYATVAANGVLSGIVVPANTSGLGYGNLTTVITVAAPQTKFLTKANTANANSVLAWKPDLSTTAANPNVIGNPAGSNRAIQYNDGGVLAGSNAFTFNKSTNLVTVSSGLFVGNVNSNTSFSISAGGNAFVVANVSNISQNTTIGNNFVTTEILTTSNHANLGNYVLIGNVDATGNVGNDRITLNNGGINIANAANANIVTSITNANVQTTNFTAINAGNVNFANTRNVNLGNVSNLHINSNAQNQYRFLQADGSNNTSWANGWFQYQPQSQWNISPYALTANSDGGNFLMVVGDAYGYYSSGISVLTTSIQSDNIVFQSDVTAFFPAGTVIRDTDNLADWTYGVVVASATYDSGSDTTTVTAGAPINLFPAVTAGDTIAFQTAVYSNTNIIQPYFNGKTVRTDGSTTSNNYIVANTFSYYTGSTIPETLLGMADNVLANDMVAGDYLYVEATQSPSIIETLSTLSGINATVDAPNRAMTLEATPAALLANGSSNINILYNGDVTISSNGVANVVRVHGNGANSTTTISGNVVISNTLTSGNIVTTGTGVTTLVSNSDINLTAANGNVNITGNAYVSNGIQVDGRARFTGNFLANGAVVNIGDVANLVITGGANGQVLTVANANPANYHLTWTSVSTNAIYSANATSGANSNIYIDPNAGNIHIGVANRANAIVIGGNSTFTQTTMRDDVTVTGNLNVQGNTNYVNVNQLSVADPLINLAVSPNGSPLVVSDAYDRGIVNHFYGANLVTTANGTAASGNTIFKLTSVTGAAVGQPVFALNTTNPVWANTTVVSNVDVANSQITTNAASLQTLLNGSQVVLGSDNLSFMGWDTANVEFVVATNVAVAGSVVSWAPANLANMQANTFKGNLQVGNANILGNGNYWAISAANTANAIVINNNLTAILSNTVNVSANGFNVNATGTANLYANGDFKITANANSNVQVANILTIGAPNIQLPTVANIHMYGGNANAAVLGTVTLNGDGNVTAIAITSRGDGYTTPPTITISGTNSLAAYATANLYANGAINTITITDPGTGYSSLDVVATITAPATKFLATNGNGNLTWQEVVATGGGGGGNASVGGTNRTVQFNDNGVLNGSNAFIFNKSSNTLTMANAVITGRTQLGGNVTATGSNVSLGSVANLHITGGINKSFLQTDGGGNLQWANSLSLNPFIRFPVMMNGNNQQFTNANIVPLGNSNFYNVTKDGVLLQPLIDWQLVSADTIQINVPLRTGSTVDILPTATDGLPGRGTDQAVPGFLQAYTTGTYTIASNVTAIIFDAHSSLFGDTIVQTPGSGIISLSGGRTYKLSGSVPTLTRVTGASTAIAVAFWDTTNNIQLGSAQTIYSPTSTSTNFAGGGTAEAIVTTPLGTTVNVVLRIVQGVDSSHTVQLNNDPEFALAQQFPWVEVLDITGLDSSAFNPSGAYGQLQFNNGGSFGGTNMVTFDPTGNGTLYSYGNVNFGNAVSNLGNVGNIYIGGGSVGQVLQTDGAGNLTWSNVGGSPDHISNGTSNVQVLSSGNVTTSVHGIANVQTVTTTGVTLGSNAGMTLQAYNGSTTQSITIQAPRTSTFTANYTLTLPPTPGTTGYVLATDGSGGTDWQFAGGGGYTPTGLPLLLVAVRQGFNTRVPTFVGGVNGYIKIAGRSGEIDVPLA